MFNFKKVDLWQPKATIWRHFNKNSLFICYKILNKIKFVDILAKIHENTYNSRPERRFDFSLFQRRPVHLFKERMPLYGRFTSLWRHTTQSPARVLRHETFQNANGIFAQPNRIQDIVVQDRLEQIVFVVRFERRLAGHHFVH